MTKTIRCCRTTLLLVAAIFVLGSATAFAQHTTGFNMAKTCPTTVASGASFFCSVTISNRDVDHGVINLTLTNQVPFPGGPTTSLTCYQPFDASECTSGGPTGTAVTSLGLSGSLTAGCGACIPETAPINCTSNNISYVDEVRASGTDAAPSGSPFFNLPLSSTTTNATPVAPLICDDNNACTTESCDPATGCTTPVAINCNDNDSCTIDSCVGGVCGHAAVDCNDNDSCTADSCVAGSCVNAPIDCNDNDACTADSCVAGSCVNTPQDCNDNNSCTNDSCVGGSCVNTAVVCNDNDICTDDSCDPTANGGLGGCVYTRDNTNDPSCIPSEEICRTPGFWGTHGGVEKTGAQNITQIVLNQYPGLTICGTIINNTTPITGPPPVDGNQSSALEAICVSPKGDSALQLARQLTATALNCILTNSTACSTPGSTVIGPGQTAGNVCGGTSIADVFSACNAACVDNGPVTAVVNGITINCIDALDCFNNGGAGLDANGACQGDSGCHDRNLVNGCFNFPNPGPAGSPRACNTARKDCLNIFGGTVACP